MVSLIKLVEISSKLVTFSERKVLQISGYFMLRSFIKIQRTDKNPRRDSDGAICEMREYS